jgi:ATP-dependent Clp protease adaptor protein ClpS
MPKSAVQPRSIADEQKQLLPRFKVLLHNDDVNDMEHVVRSLVRVFRFDRARCEQIMMEAHRKGVALCTLEPLEQAEFHRDQLTAFSLTATIEPE